MLPCYFVILNFVFIVLNTLSRRAIKIFKKQLITHCTNVSDTQHGVSLYVVNLKNFSSLKDCLILPDYGQVSLGSG
jgi:hypothetical protein